MNYLYVKYGSLLLKDILIIITYIPPFLAPSKKIFQKTKKFKEIIYLLQWEISMINFVAK